jgi:hypothetical protein
MKKERTDLTMAGLQWSLGIVVVVQSAMFAFSPGGAHFFAKTGLPGWVRPALGGAEILAALLFLVRRTVMVGGYSLVVIFFLAIIVHMLHGWFDVGGLVVYAAAALAVTACRAERANPGV